MLVSKILKPKIFIALIILTLGGSLACDSKTPDAKNEFDAATTSDATDGDDAPVRDATDSEIDTTEISDARDTSPNTNDGGDAEDADITREPVEFDASLWQQENPCTGEVSFPEEHEPYSVPTRPQPSQAPVITRDDLIDELGFFPNRAISVRPGKAVRPGDGRSFDLYAQPGTDVPIHIYSINDADEPEDFEPYSLNVTVMVDYAPVEATYERWSPDRTQKLLETTATGINVDLESDFEILDVTIPAAVFAERRMYEISVSYNLTTYDGRSNGESRRFALFNGGYDRPSRPCAEPKIDVPWSDWEKTLYNRGTVDDLGPLFYEGITSELDIQSLVDVEPGETRRMFFSVLQTSSQAGGKPTVLVPLFDGEPMGPVWWVKQGGEDNYRVRVNARKSFEVTFPEEPGVYVVQVATWEDPYLYWRTRDGVRNEDVSLGSSRGLHESSNPVHFRVVDPSSP
jgi:hypothetical protein